MKNVCVILLALASCVSCQLDPNYLLPDVQNISVKVGQELYKKQLDAIFPDQGKPREWLVMLYHLAKVQQDSFNSVSRAISDLSFRDPRRGTLREIFDAVESIKVEKPFRDTGFSLFH